MQKYGIPLSRYTVFLKLSFRVKFILGVPFFNLLRKTKIHLP